MYCTEYSVRSSVVNCRVIISIDTSVRAKQNITVASSEIHACNSRHAPAAGGSVFLHVDVKREGVVSVGLGLMNS